VSIVVPVTAGPHTVYLLGRKDNVSTTTGTVRYVGRTVTAQFIAQDALGQLSLAESGAFPAGDPSSLRFLRGR
jgi:hypothetical protein